MKTQQISTINYTALWTGMLVYFSRSYSKWLPKKQSLLNLNGNAMRLSLNEVLTFNLKTS